MTEPKADGDVAYTAMLRQSSLFFLCSNTTGSLSPESIRGMPIISWQKGWKTNTEKLRPQGKSITKCHFLTVFLLWHVLMVAELVHGGCVKFENREKVYFRFQLFGPSWLTFAKHVMDQGDW
jgi:hypothetical protein